MLRVVRDKLRSRRRRPSHSESVAASEDRQPPVFRNRSIDLLQNPFNLFPRRRSTVDDTPPEPSPSATQSNHNEDSFSSIPSTHASRDPFLNDDVPVDISRNENTDRPRKENEGAKSNLEKASPPISISSGSTLRKRSSLWKRSYDPDAGFQSIHERDILKAVSLSEAAVKNGDVIAACQLAHILNNQVDELANMLQHVQTTVQQSKAVANTLPSARSMRFETLLEDTPKSHMDDKRDRAMLHMQWTKSLWDLEGYLVEKRYDDCVVAIQKLSVDRSQIPSRESMKLTALKDQLINELATLCAGSLQAAEIYAPIVKKLDAAEQSRILVLEEMRRELFAELRHAAAHAHDTGPRYVNVILNSTLTLIRRAYQICSKLSFTDCHNSTSFAAWVVEQSDEVYEEFIHGVFTRLGKADPITVFSTIEAAQKRPVWTDRPLKDCEISLLSLLESRIKVQLGKDLDVPMREAERQLIARAKMFASAVPRNWREGPYQSGTAMSDELSVIGRGLAGIWMADGHKEDIYMRMLVVPAVTYCATLLYICKKSVKDETGLSMRDVEGGLTDTISMIGQALSGAKAKETGVKETGVKETGVKENGMKENGVKETAVKKMGVKETRMKRMGVKEMGVKGSDVSTIERVAAALQSRNVGDVMALQLEVKRARIGRQVAGRRASGNKRGSISSCGAWKGSLVRGEQDDEERLAIRAKALLMQLRTRAVS